MTADNIKGKTDIPLIFNSENFKLKTVNVETSEGDKKVLYRAYTRIPYAAKPVDMEYQSMDINVPVEINGTAVDASDAPVLFDIGVQGYLYVNNYKNSDKPLSERAQLALAAGFVVAAPGCRGRNNRASDGTYYGKAPAVITDLKAAVRYLRHNSKNIPGNMDLIITNGCSAGGALSALLGVSGNSPLYKEYLKDIGAAEEKDNVYACACFSPITDLEHSDMSYEWMYGDSPMPEGLVNQEISGELKKLYSEYQESLNIKGKDNFGIVTSENYQEYLLKYYLIPSADRYLTELNEKEREEYLAENKWIKWNGNTSEFTFSDYVKHAGRMKGLPAFDDFDMKAAEPILFGIKTVNARHFTDFSLRHTCNNPDAEIDDEIKTLRNLMNAMYFIRQNNSDFAGRWYMRNGTCDNHNSQTIMINLVTSLENKGMDVNTWIYWDGLHCADDDPEGFIAWIRKITGC